MKIDLTQVLVNFKGLPLKTDDGELTLGFIASNALLAFKMEGRMKTYELARKLYTEKEVTVDTADFAIIKKAVEAATEWNNLVVGQALEMLEKCK